MIRVASVPESHVYVQHLSHPDVPGVVRLPDPDDRRVWMVAITPSGRERVDRLNEIDTVLRAQLRSGISRAERQQLAAVLVRLQRNLVAAVQAEAIQGASPSPTQPPRSET